jgi:hypothetical protein
MHTSLVLAAQHDWVPEVLGPDAAPASPRREVEAFVAHVYRQRFDARLATFMPSLLAFRDREGRLRAAVGLRRARSEPLFVEQYIDRPAEQAVAAALGRCIDRDAMVEVGGMAASRPGDARRLILSMTRGLHHAGVRWVLFAATRQLRNAFDRLGLETVALAPALPERLQPGATDWGRYYDTAPTLVCGDIAAGIAFLDRAERDGLREVGT